MKIIRSNGLQIHCTGSEFVSWQFLQLSRANSTQIFWLLPVKMKPFEEFVPLKV